MSGLDGGHPTVRVGRLIVSTVRQAGGHPWVDQAASIDADGIAYRAWVVRPSLLRMRDRPGGIALVIGWRR